MSARSFRNVKLREWVNTSNVMFVSKGRSVDLGRERRVRMFGEEVEGEKSFEVKMKG